MKTAKLLTNLVALLSLTYLATAYNSLSESDSNNKYESFCSDRNSSTPIDIKLERNADGYLLSHRFNYALENAPLVHNLVPFVCKWRLLLAEDAAQREEIVALEFEELDIPESELTDEEIQLAELGDESAVEASCSQNYVKVSTIDTPQAYEGSQLLAGYCGNGKVPKLDGSVGKSLLVEVKITRPFKGFKIRFEKSHSLGEGRSIGSGFCSSDSLFACADPRTGVKCIPSSYKCDGFSDCKDGEDEADCTEQTTSTTARADTSVDSGCGSPRRMQGVSGVVRSMNYPKQPYSNNARCYWFITSPKGTHIKINFKTDKFGIERRMNGIYDNDDDCLHDSLTFYLYGYEKTSSTERPLTLFSKICGAFPPNATTLPHNQVVVTFDSNDFNNFDGFEFAWKAINPKGADVSDEDASRSEFVASSPDYEQEQADYGIDEPESGNTLAYIPDRGAWPGSNTMAERQNPPEDTSRGHQPGSVIGVPGQRPAPDPCLGNGVIVRSVSGMISTPAKLPTNPSQACYWRIDPRLPAGSTQVKVDIRFYDFTVDPSQDCSRPVFEIVFVGKSGQTIRGKYSCGAKMPPFEEEQTATSTRPVTIIFHPEGKRHRFDIGFIVVATKNPAGVGSSGPVYPDAAPARPPFQLVRNCGKSTAAVPATSFGDYGGTASISRIVGGRPAKPGSWPWATELAFHGQHMCGGTVLDDTWILTAAHCFKGMLRRKPGWQVIIGRHTTTSNTAWDHQSQPLRPRIERIMVHKQYMKNPSDKSYDIALIQLKDKLTNPRLALPACLPRRPIRTSDKCMVIGWGATKGTGHEGTLKEAKMPIFDNNKCRAMNTVYAAQVKDTMVCAGYEQGGIDSCQGDSGGPLLCYVDNRWEVHGVVSFGKGCAGAKAPGVYTRVWSYMDWLEKVTTLAVRTRRDIEEETYYYDEPEPRFADNSLSNELFSDDFYELV